MWPVSDDEDDDAPDRGPRAPSLWGGLGVSAACGYGVGAVAAAVVAAAVLVSGEMRAADLAGMAAIAACLTAIPACLAAVMVFGFGPFLLFFWLTGGTAAAGGDAEQIAAGDRGRKAGPGP